MLSILVNAMFGGHWEILLIVGLAVLLFGSAKLPKLFNNMGRSINEFKAGMAQKPENLEDESKKKKDSKKEAEAEEEKETADV